MLEEPASIAEVLHALEDSEFQLHLQSIRAEQMERELLGEDVEKVRAWVQQELRELFSWYQENAERWTITAEETPW